MKTPPARPLSLDDFDYALPPAQIAQTPPPRRSGARLLDVRGKSPRPRRFQSLPGLLRAGDILVFNDSKVIPARLQGAKESGGRAEIFAERFLPDGEVLAQVRAAKPPRPGAVLNAAGRFVVQEKTADGFYRLRAETPNGAPVPARPRFLRRGITPLPPYIRRAPDENDKRRYQSVFARHPGSVAAPTASLHFDAAILQTLARRGIETAKITLHIGAGTFLPLRRGLQSRLHAERYRISAAAAGRINAAKKRGGRVIAAGTTVLRALESAADNNGVCAAEAETELFIKPGYCFRAADILLTNFHLPRSSLLVLACAFGGRRRVLAACCFAVQNKFRFYTYGDAMLLSRAAG
ncbi:MAG: tRNA preQ1(34) S-adenosylmethionine ribosyltransferase-isomerase QueA [Gammaproteobacteria bacterium]